MEFNMSLIIPDSVRVPPVAYNFIPGIEMIYRGRDKKIQRSIFANQNYTDLENNMLENLEKEIKINKLEIPANWDRSYLLRFCYGSG